MWTPKKIRVTIEEPFDSILLQAEEMGAFTVYPRNLLFPEVSEPLGYVLNHGPTGRSVVKGLSQEDSKRIGEYLWARYVLVFKKEDLEEVLEKIPPLIKDWIQLCEREGKWIEPITLQGR